MRQDGMEQWQDLGSRGLKYIDLRPGPSLSDSFEEGTAHHHSPTSLADLE